MSKQVRPWEYLYRDSTSGTVFPSFLDLGTHDIAQTEVITHTPTACSACRLGPCSGITSSVPSIEDCMHRAVLVRTKVESEVGDSEDDDKEVVICRSAGGGGGTRLDRF